MKILFISLNAVAAEKPFEIGDFVFCKVDRNKWLVAKVIKVVRKLFTCEYSDNGTDTFEASELLKATKEIFTKIKDGELTTKEVDAYTKSPKITGKTVTRTSPNAVVTEKLTRNVKVKTVTAANANATAKVKKLASSKD